jgi:hypothetical protein
MSTEQLTRILAERVMGWRIAPGRFLKSGRAWLPTWRFQPLKRLDHALELLNRATEVYAITSRKNGSTRVVVHIGNRSGSAEDRSKPRAITHAVAQALGIHANEPCRGGHRDGVIKRL